MALVDRLVIAHEHARPLDDSHADQRDREARGDAEADVHGVGVEDAASLRKSIEQAKAEHRALFVIQGYNNFNRQLLPDGFKLLDDKSLFAEAAAFAGIDPEFYFRVFRMVGL